jgi:hypothetical protein
LLGRWVEAVNVRRAIELDPTTMETRRGRIARVCHYPPRAFGHFLHGNKDGTIGACGTILLDKMGGP